jgi:hypothetical protein
MAIRGRSGPLVTLRRQPIPKLFVAVADPTGAIVVPALGANVTLNWDASPTSGVTAYSIFRRTGVTGVAFVPGTDTPIATGVAALTYTDSGLSSGTYEYQVFGEIGATVWTPASIAGLLSWHDATNSGSITASGGLVSQWSDLSGNSRHLTQASGSLQPQTGGNINGVAALTFDNVDDVMGTGGFLTSNCTIFTVQRIDSNDSWNVMSISGTPRDISYSNSASQINTWSSTDGDYLTCIISMLNPTIDCVRYASTGTCDRRIYSAEEGFRAANTTGKVSGLSGASMTIGTFARTLGGVVGEVIIYDSVLSDTDRETVIQYLEAKWGLALSPSLAGIVAWYDASRPTTITASSGSVSQWNDLSPLGRNVVQPTGANQPVTGTRTLNSKNVLDFGGSNFFNQNDISPNLAQPLTVLAVLSSDNVDSGNRQFLGNFSGTQPTMFVNADTWRMYDGTEINTGQAETSASVQVVGVFNGASSEYYFNGTQIATGVNPGTNPVDTISIGHDGGGAAFMWDGTIAELIILDHAITSTERTSWNAYVTAKWGI